MPVPQKLLLGLVVLLSGALWGHISGDTCVTGKVSVLKGAQPSLLGTQQETVLVTGGLGFIGSHVVEALLERNFQVIVYDDESNGHNYHPSSLNLHGDIIQVHDFRQLEQLHVQVSYMVHLAAAISVAESMTQPEKYNRTNLAGSSRAFIWAMAHGVKHTVAASSAAVYGDPPAASIPIRETVPYGGLSPYAATKYGMEKIMEDMSAKYGFCSTALRFFNVYGPRQDPKSAYSGVISLFMDRAKDEQEIPILGDGEQTRDFIYVKDVARGIITAMTSGRCKFDAYNICTGRKTTINGLAKMVVDIFGSSSVVTHKAPRPGDIRLSLCNPQKAKDNIGFIAHTKVDEGLRQTKKWFVTS